MTVGEKAFASLDAHLDTGLRDGCWIATVFGRNLTDFASTAYSVAMPLVPASLFTWLPRTRQADVGLPARC